MIPTRWYSRLALLLVGVGLLTAAFAPVGQFYLAWVGLVPWMLVARGTGSYKSAFFWSWLAGTLFFIANMWWMAFVTVPGMFGLMALLGLYWGYAGLLLRGIRGVKSPVLVVVLTAMIWVAAAEWFRGTWPWHGLPWLYLGHTQSNVLVLCQIADVTGVAGISFLIAAMNALIALLLVNRPALRPMIPAILLMGFGLIVTLGYGVYRLKDEKLIAGPTIAVVQPNYPQSNSGQKGATEEEMVEFHLRTSESLLSQHAGVDLLVWSETMMPPMNVESREYFEQLAIENPQNLNIQQFAHTLFGTFDQCRELTAASHAALLSGGDCWKDFKDEGGYDIATDKRNVSYFFDRSGNLSPEHYDKIHLVPFGEFTPFRYGFPAFYRLLVKFGPADMEYYFLQPGSEDHMTMFDLSRPDGPPWRLATPICFEDIDDTICAHMVRPLADTPNQKNADVLINLTNDGWFRANENSQHLQVAIFRSIENRVPTARSVNTGISGFIDPLGHPHDLMEVRTAGGAVATVQLCRRVTFFTRHGPVFGELCGAGTVVTAVICFGAWAVNKFRKPLTIG